MFLKHFFKSFETSDTPYVLKLIPAYPETFQNHDTLIISFAFDTNYTQSYTLRATHDTQPYTLPAPHDTQRYKLPDTHDTHPDTLPAPHDTPTAGTHPDSS